MTEYIDREAALALVRPDDPNDERYAVTVATAKRLIRHVLTDAPAADVAPVVRCKDCEHFDRNVFDFKGFKICPASGMYITPEDYCSYAERKET